MVTMTMSMCRLSFDPPVTRSFGTSSCCAAHTFKQQTDSHSEGGIDFDEEQEPDVYDDNDDQAGGAEDPDNQDPNDDNIVVSGDASAAAAAKDKVKNTVENEKDKRVDNDKRTTTPYMTKYERARVLGTRALQIRWV
jgi:DNA-directed RNA polymerase I, II, and III subunit RPABC2